MTSSSLKSARRARRADPPLRLGTRPQWLAGVGRLARRGLDLLGVLLPDVLAIELLLAATFVLFRDAILGGLVFHETDTTTMFYPVFAALGAALERGELLLWSRHLFSGFPLLAEGQTGALYPPNWVAATRASVHDGFVWVRVAHYAAAVLFGYLLGRSLRLGPGPSAIVGLSSGFGSFMVGQMQHASVVASAVWLPLILALTELGLRAAGLRRHRYFLLAGLALGLAALGIHMQPVVMSGGCLVAWIAFRAVFPTRASASTQADDLAPVSGPGSASRPRLHALASGLVRGGGGLSRRLALAIWASALIPTVAVAVAAAQLLPLYELSTQSGRAGIWSYQVATDYSLPVPNLLTLIFPFFFRSGEGTGWSLWQPWEVTYYAGVIPLALAVLGVLAARRVEILFFLLLGLFATLLALGDYSPLPLYETVWSWPGVNLQRAPARFSFLGVLAIAVLAGFGAQALWDRLRAWPSGARPTHRTVLLWTAALIGSLGAVVWHLAAWRAWLTTEPLQVLRYVEEAYLSQRRDPGVVDTAQDVYSGLWQSLDLTNRHTALPLLLLLALVLLVVCWNELRRARAIWQALLALLVAVDMVSFARQYHPLVSIDEIADVGEAGRFLARQSGLFRVYTHPEVRAPRPNQLLPGEVSEARAYDPLELSRHRVFIGTVHFVDNWLQDLLGVRYRVAPAQQPGLPSFRQTGFHPEHPLLSGTAANPSGRAVWRASGEPADELRVVSALQDGFGISDGETIGEWILTTAAGSRILVPMIAGRDTADGIYDDPLHSARPAHSRATIAFRLPPDGPIAEGEGLRSLYYTAFALAGQPAVVGAEFKYTHPIGRIHLYGFGFFERRSASVAQFFQRENYRTAYQDSEVVIEENLSTFPRAFAVPRAVFVETPEEALVSLTEGPLQPRRQVVLEVPAARQGSEAPVEPPSARPEDRLGEPYGEVLITEYGNEAVGLRTRTAGGYLVLGDAFYPGWKAYVNGEERPILRANYLFRAVELPPGDHLVQFRYQPHSFALGQDISRLAVGLAALGLLGTFLVPGCAARAGGLRTS